MLANLTKGFQASTKAPCIFETVIKYLPTQRNALIERLNKYIFNHEFSAPSAVSRGENPLVPREGIS